MTTEEATAPVQDKDRGSKKGLMLAVFLGAILLVGCLSYLLGHRGAVSQDKASDVITEGTTISQQDGVAAGQEATVAEATSMSAEAGTVAEDAEPLYYAILNYDYDRGIAVHPTPDKEADVVGRIQYLCVFPVYKEVPGATPGTTYGYTRYQNFEGYINLEYAEVTSASQETDEPEPLYWAKINYYYKKGIAVHSEADRKALVVGHLYYEEEFPVYYEREGTTYAFTVMDDFSGFVNMEYAERIN